MTVLKAKKRASTSKGKEKAMEEVTKEEYTRLNVMVESKKYKEFFLKARMSGSDMTKKINEWIDNYLDD